MYDETIIRTLLIDSCHSSKEAETFFISRLSDARLLALLVRIAHDTEENGGDAPMQAAYFASQFSGRLLAPFETTLFELLPRADGYAGFVAVALGKTRSTQSKQAILVELRDGSRIDAWLFEKALKELEHPQIED